ncbi:uncharacterized protein [Salminus brasiliensis]|uniref:uncharacterized protein isoform X2 n=1 Tax=Salminus brasiliensis TaxID=930266 RepID=UPI003B836CFB
MGSAASRAKRVAPALETQNNALERRGNLEGGRLFSSPKAPASDLRRSQRHFHSEGRESGPVSDEEKLETEVERILGACGSADGGLSRRLFQKAFFSSKTCGLCYGQGGQTTNTSSDGSIRVVYGEGLSRGHHFSEDREETSHKPVAGGRADPVCTKAAW